MLRIILAALAIGSTVAISGCSFSPVYADHDPRGMMSLAFDLGEPNSRVEQVIYQDIALRFAVSSAPKTPKLIIAATNSAQDVMKSAEENSALPEALRVTVTATATATYEGKPIFEAERTASATYTRSGQVLADNAARDDAEERAAKAVAESLRLAILATFPSHASYLN